jgi:hypothetical protein
VFSVRSVPRCYKQNSKWRKFSCVSVSKELVNCCGSVLVSCCCQKLVTEMRDSSESQRKGERPPLEADTEQRLAETEKIVCVL